MRKVQTRTSKSASVASRPPRPPVRLGVIGMGTVGTGTIKVLTEHAREVERRVGCRLELKTICSVS